MHTGANAPKFFYVLYCEQKRSSPYLSKLTADVENLLHKKIGKDEVSNLPHLGTTLRSSRRLVFGLFDQSFQAKQRSFHGAPVSSDFGSE